MSRPLCLCRVGNSADCFPSASHTVTVVKLRLVRFTIATVPAVTSCFYRDHVAWYFCRLFSVIANAVEITERNFLENLLRFRESYCLSSASIELCGRALANISSRVSESELEAHSLFCAGCMYVCETRLLNSFV